MKNIFEKRYRIVAYNNRMYDGWKFIDSELYTLLSGKFWIENYGDRDRYLYDFYDIKEKKLVYDYTQMIKDYKAVKKVINFHNNNGLHEETLLNYIFNFKKKWEKIHHPKAPQIYFEDLMTMYNMKMKSYNGIAELVIN